MVLGNTFGLVVSDVGSIDNSPPERIPHEEYVGKDLAKARLLMPLNLSRLDQRIENMEDKLINLDKKTIELIFLLRNAIIS